LLMAVYSADSTVESWALYLVEYWAALTAARKAFQKVDPTAELKAAHWVAKKALMTAAYLADLTAESWALYSVECWVESTAERKALPWVAQKAVMTAV